ncbi:MAG: hypothetical protein LBC75_10855 [Fibromonadaceae bacterium]|nr:hypothetical protein [Fibromonadaceae bacterium]
MLRFLIILLLCALFAACSSDNSATVKEWFDNQGIATSYGKDSIEIEISLKNSKLGRDTSTSTSMVSSFAVLGNANNVEQILYFGLRTVGKLDSVWNLKPDSVFYANFYEGNIPDEHKNIQARFYWSKETETVHDTTWLKFQKPFTDSADISIDSFSVLLPTKFRELKADTLRLFVGIKLLTNNAILRIAAPAISDISGLLRVAQKTHVESCGDLCLHGGVRESLDVVFEVGKNKIKANKTVVFAQLVLPKSSDTTGSELGRAVPVLVFNEEYRIDTDFVEKNGHSNLVFWEGDTLKLQVTKKLRNYVPNTFSLTLRLGNPTINPKSLSFSNIRPAYSSYNFNTAFEGAKLRLWYAETDNH